LDSGASISCIGGQLEKAATEFENFKSLTIELLKVDVE